MANGMRRQKKRHIIDTLLHNKVCHSDYWAHNIRSMGIQSDGFLCDISLLNRDSICATGGSVLQNRASGRWLKATLGQFYLNLYCIHTNGTLF